MYNRNLLQQINQSYNWADYKTFKAHLCLPLPYLVVLFKNFSKPHDMVYSLSKVIERYHEHLWGKMKDKLLHEKLFQVANIPPLYVRETKLTICNKAKEQQYFDTLVLHAAKLVGTSKQLYFHSAFSEAAMIAASKIAMSAITNTESPNAQMMFGKVYCCNFGTYMETVKETWDTTVSIIKQTREAELLVLYGVGNEYTTEFNSTYLFALLDQRAMEGRSTILVSSLTPAEFNRRYGKEFAATTIEFVDNKVKQTLEDLVKELSNG